MWLTKVRQFARSLVACALIMSFSGQRTFAADSHVVELGELKDQVASASRARQLNRQKVDAFLSAPGVEKALRTARFDPQRVHRAVAALDDQELARLAARASKIQADLDAGRLTDRDLLLILIGIAALILIIVAVD
jgi:hypothetical protein